MAFLQREPQPGEYLGNGWHVAEVKWYNRVYGFGFLKWKPREHDIFIHRGLLLANGLPDLRPNQKVGVRFKETHKGLFATDVRLL